MALTPDEAAMPKARSVFAELARLLGGQSFFTGETMTLADLLVAPHKNLVAWLARMEARPSLQATTWERVTEMAQAA